MGRLAQLKRLYLMGANVTDKGLPHLASLKNLENEVISMVADMLSGDEQTVGTMTTGGTESICSDFAELPHPHFWSRPPATAKVGTPFSYQAGVIRSNVTEPSRNAPAATS